MITLQVPDFKLPGLSPFLYNLLNAINKDTDTKIDKIKATRNVLLLSPDDHVWSITVANDGTLHTS